MPKPSPYTEEIILALKAGDSVEEVTKRFPVSRRTVERHAKQLKEGKLEEKEKPSKEKQGGKLVTVTARQPAPVVFVLGERKIELDPEALYESYLLYEDIKAKCSLTDSFSDVLRDGVALLWQLLVKK